MDNEDKRNVWSVHGASVEGASHKRSGLPNQDAIKWTQGENGLPIMLAIADGHGSATYFRSHLGAQFAVKIALEEMETSLRELPVQNMAMTKELLRQLPASIVEKWQQTVTKHWEEAMPTQAEWKRFQANPKLLEAFQHAQKNPLLPYGATLLCVMVTPSFIFYFQLGDGDIQVVTEGGQVIRAVKDDSRLLANETTSLCSTTPALAKRDFRVTFNASIDLKNRKVLPALILVSTDGYANSFSTPEDFQQVGRDILQMLSKEGGVEKVKKDLPGWLDTASLGGSGDDISLGLIWKPEYIERAVEALATRASTALSAKPAAHSEQQSDQPALPIVPEQDRAKRGDYIPLNEDILPSQKAPGVLDLLLLHIKEPERPPRERWEVEHYSPPSHTMIPASGTNSASSQSDGSIDANETHTQDSSSETQLAPAQNSQNGHAAAPVADPSINTNQQDQKEDRQEQKPSSPQQKASVQKQEAGVTADTSQAQSAAIAGNQAANDQKVAPAHQGETTASQEEDLEKTILRSDLNIPKQFKNEPLVKDMSKIHRLIVRQRPQKGEYATIKDALKEARDGTLISVYPGTYKDRLSIERDVTIQCEEELKSVVIESTVPCVQIKAKGALIYGLQISGSGGMGLKSKDTAAVEIEEGQSTLTMCDISSSSPIGVRVRGATTNPALRKCYIHDGKGAGVIFSVDAKGTLDDCDILHQQGTGVEIRASNPTIQNCRILSNKEDGIRIGKDAKGSIHKCLIANQGRANIVISDGGNPTISECRILSANGPGVRIVNQGNGIIQSCVIQKNQGSGILLEQNSGAHIHHCLLSRGKENGIVMDTHSIAMIQDCDILEHQGKGLWLLNGSNAQIEDCRIKDNRIGIQLQEKCEISALGGQIANHQEREIGIYHESHLTMKNVNIDRLQKHDYAVVLLGICTGTLEGCTLQAHDHAIATQDHVTLHLKDCEISSQTSFALWAAQESEVTILGGTLHTDNIEQDAIFSEESQVHFVK